MGMKMSSHSGLGGAGGVMVVTFASCALLQKRRTATRRTGGNADMATAICTRTEIFGEVYEGWHKWSLVLLLLSVHIHCGNTEVHVFIHKERGHRD